MAETLICRNELNGGRMRHLSTIRGFAPIITDYPLPHGDDTGPTSLELLLASLGTCAANSVAHLLRRRQGTIDSLVVVATGVRRTVHPLSFESIALELELTTPDISPSDLAVAVAQAEAAVCPVWNMLKTAVPISVTTRVLPSA